MFYGKKRSPKQEEQQKLWQALGTVLGFKGYLTNLNFVVCRTSIYQNDKYRLSQSILNLREQLDNIEASIRTELKDL